MNGKTNQDTPFESDEINGWLKKYFLDPYTAFLDETLFPIDLYESESSFIVESHLPNVKGEGIHLIADQNTLTITVEEPDPINGEKREKTRSISFPLPIVRSEIQAKFQNQILEIIINKE